VALSTVLSIGIVNILQLRPAAKLLDVPFSRVLPWKDAFKTLVIAGVAALITGLTLRANLSPQVTLIVGLPVFAAIYAALAVRLRLVSKDEIFALTQEFRSAFQGMLSARRERQLASQSL